MKRCLFVACNVVLLDTWFSALLMSDWFIYEQAGGCGTNALIHGNLSGSFLVYWPHAVLTMVWSQVSKWLKTIIDAGMHEWSIILVYTCWS